jgi:G:T-mismatch repair DNA endonuclease (very short patch repair protein)
MCNNVKCKICNEQIGRKGLSLHLKYHSIKFEDYIKNNLIDFPNYHKCEICNNITNKKRFCSKNCTTIWRKTLVGQNALRYNKKLSDTSINKMSNTLKELYKDKQKHGRYKKINSQETKDKIGIANKYKTNGNKHYLWGKKLPSETIRKIFENKPMNKLETKVAEYLDKNKIEYTFQFFINNGDICKSYDFKLKNSNVILEIHGDYWHGGIGVTKHVFNVDNNIENDKLKIELAKSKGYNVIVIWESEIKKDISIINKKINEYLYKSK